MCLLKIKCDPAVNFWCHVSSVLICLFPSRASFYPCFVHSPAAFSLCSCLPVFFLPFLLIYSLFRGLSLVQHLEIDNNVLFLHCNCCVKAAHSAGCHILTLNKEICCLLLISGRKVVASNEDVTITKVPLPSL